MKILNVVSHALFPISDGGRAHSFSNIVELAKTNHILILSPDESLLSTHSDQAISLAQYSISKSKLKYLSPMFLFQIKRLSKTVDRVILDYPWFALHCLILNIPYEIREHNIEFLRFKSYRSWFWPILYVYEKIAYKYAKKIHCISQEDKDTLLEYFNTDHNKCLVTPYFPDSSRFYPTTKYKDEIRKSLKLQDNELFILFFGKLDYKPNLEALNIICQEIIPRLNQHSNFEFKVVVCGKNAPNILNDKVTMLGCVDNIESYVQSCDVMINPIVSGGGVKTKVLETLACNKKVISTEQGAIGVNSEPNLIIIKDWDDMVAKLLERQPVTSVCNGDTE